MARRATARARRRTLARGALGGVLLLEAAEAWRRQRARVRLYAQAAARARALGRPLVVVGAPRGGAFSSLLPSYGCGDITVDLAGAAGCPNVRAVDLAAGPVPGVPDDGAVVFVSCVLEYVPDLAAAWREVLRMAGAPANAFVVTVAPWSLSGVFYPGARWLLDGSPAGAAGLRARPDTAARRLAYAAALGALGVAAW